MVFPCLEELYISYINVERIWDDKLSDCNQKLTRLIIKGCDKLKHLLSTSMARSMVHLNYLKVQNCDSLREIISSVEGNVAEGGVAKDDTMTQIFPKLESLVLSTLRDLERFCHGNQFEFSSLKTLRIWGCFSLKTFISDTMVESETHGQEAEEKSEIYFSRLFNEKVVFPCLEELDISYINVERIWDDKLSDCNQKLTSLSIWRCDKLKHLLSTSMARSLVHLNYLKVHGCKSLREIISTEGNVAEAVAKDYMMTQIFPKLESLVLNHLPKLKRFCCGNQFKFSSLKTLIIWECPSFTTFVTDHVGEEVEENKSRINFSPLFNEKVVLPMVEDLRIRGFWEYGMINKL
ncbi:putative Disease resistance protein RPS5 [Corchorus olitorius]|uniref:Disease resistance protein RPS5 n=1 Tax=Corchorus olitorius TaxID=93759 RepID=A0A1R3KY93_9ROSI|nr:putative Disease resistance protein RPS5 [Corchorus olitorius]